MIGESEGNYLKITDRSSAIFKALSFKNLKASLLNISNDLRTLTIFNAFILQVEQRHHQLKDLHLNLFFYHQD